MSLSTNMNDGLIELARNHPVLYDLSQPEYMDSSLKQHIWNDIGQEIKVDGKYFFISVVIYSSFLSNNIKYESLKLLVRLSSLLLLRLFSNMQSLKLPWHRSSH